MKILVVTDKLFPDETGGSCTYAYETIKCFEKNNLVDIFTCYPDKKENDKNFWGHVYRKFNKRHPFKSSRELIKVINENKYDCTIFHSAYSWLIYKIIKRKIKCSNQSFIIYHGPWHREAESKYLGSGHYLKSKILPKIMNLIESKMIQDNSNFIFLSNYMKSEAKKTNSSIENKNTRIIPGGINQGKYKRKYTKLKAKEKLGLKPDDFVVFTLRRLEYRMGIQNAIKSIPYIKSVPRDNIKLLIGGKGTYGDYLKKLANDNNLNNCVKFLGFIPDDRINLYFCAADIFLVPSIDLEGFGLVNLESIAMGVPVLATPQGGMVELEKMVQNMYVTEGFEDQDIAKKIDEIYPLVCNKVISEDLSKFSWDMISGTIENFISGTLKLGEKLPG